MLKRSCAIYFCVHFIINKWLCILNICMYVISVSSGFAISVRAVTGCICCLGRRCVHGTPNLYAEVNLQEIEDSSWIFSYPLSFLSYPLQLTVFVSLFSRKVLFRITLSSTESSSSRSHVRTIPQCNRCHRGIQMICRITMRRISVFLFFFLSFFFLASKASLTVPSENDAYRCWWLPIVSMSALSVKLCLCTLDSEDLCVCVCVCVCVWWMTLLCMLDFLLYYLYFLKC